MKGLLQVLVVAAAAYTGICVVLFLAQHRLIFYPRPVDVEPVGPHVAPVAVPRGEITLRGWIVNEASAGPLLVYFGGNAEDVSGRVEDFAHLDATTVLMCYRGYGGSDGTPTAADLVTDARAVVEAMRNRFGQGRETILFGRSLGSGIAALAAAATAVDGLILLSPYVSLKRVAQDRFPVFPVRWILRHDIDASRSVDGLPRDVLVLYARHDNVIPTAESRAFVDLLPAPPQVVEFAGSHNAPLSTPEIRAAIEGFLKESGR